MDHPDSFRLNSEENDSNCLNSFVPEVNLVNYCSFSSPITFSKNKNTNNEQMYWSKKVGNIESIKLQQILYKLLLKKQGSKERHNGR